MRSPCGLGIIDGELFYTDNQGDWIGSGGLWHVAKGDFMGNPGGLKWTGSAASPLKLSTEELYSKIDPRRSTDSKGNYIRPENVVDEKFVTLADMKKEVPSIRLPAVWLPYGLLGISTSEPISIPENAFGPFAGQVLVGDQGMSILSRVFMEKVKGEYQGASFAFRSGFKSGVVRLAWGRDGSLFVGETRRGWGSSGDADEGLERLVWNDQVPFEMKAVRAMPDGFEIEFTSPADPQTAGDLASYAVESFIYKYHPVYGSPPVNSEKCKVMGIKLSDGGRRARIIVDHLRTAYIHTITVAGVREQGNASPLLHPTAYYTLNNIPDGQKLSMDEVSHRNSAVDSENNSAVPATGKGVNSKRPLSANSDAKTGEKAVPAHAPGFFDVKGLLVNYTCVACHATRNKQVGPGFLEIARRHYSNEKIVELINSPQPQNWPDYATAMPPMPQVTSEDALKIAGWINSLDD
jgi:cytochrome c551/c552